MKLLLSSLLTALFLFLFGLFFACGASAQESPEEAKDGAIQNVEYLFSSIEELKQIQATLEADKIRMNNLLTIAQTEITRMREEADSISMRLSQVSAENEAIGEELEELQTIREQNEKLVKFLTDVIEWMDKRGELYSNITTYLNSLVIPSAETKEQEPTPKEPIPVETPVETPSANESTE